MTVTNPYSLRTQYYTFWESIPAGIHKAGKTISSYWDQLKLIVQPKTKMYEELGGFVAIGSIFPGSWDWHDFWLKTAFLSIILAVMNLLPIRDWTADTPCSPCGRSSRAASRAKSSSRWPNTSA